MITELLILVSLILFAGLLVAALESKNCWIRGLGNTVLGTLGFLFIYIPIKLAIGAGVVLAFGAIVYLVTPSAMPLHLESWLVWGVVIGVGVSFAIKDLIEWLNDRRITKNKDND